MATEIEAAKLLTYYAAERKDHGQSVTTEAAMAKVLRFRGGREGSQRSRAGVRRVRLHQRFPVEKFYRDAKLCTIGEGTSEIQKLVIARNILK
jgi:alkylation response protein AidB-like acyl-CoA dehydrogenase